jgi:hypothetical protein
LSVNLLIIIVIFVLVEAVELLIPRNIIMYKKKQLSEGVNLDNFLC